MPWRRRAVLVLEGLVVLVGVFYLVTVLVATFAPRCP